MLKIIDRFRAAKNITTRERFMGIVNVIGNVLELALR